MGFMDKISGNADRIRGKVTQAVNQHGDTIDKGIDKAGRFVSTRTGGKYDTHIRKGSEQLRGGLDKLDEQDDFGGTPPSPQQPGTVTAPPPPPQDSQSPTPQPPPPDEPQPAPPDEPQPAPPAQPPPPAPPAEPDRR